MPDADAFVGEPARPEDPARHRLTLREEAAATALGAASWFLARLPAAPLHRLAHLVGVGWYLAAPGQRALARANLRRVCTWLETNRMASPRVAAAAHDPAALERLLRDAFGHRARYYLEVARSAPLNRAFLESHLILDNNGVVERILRRDGPALVLGLHLGALELPAQYLTVSLGRHAVAPMETLRNRPLQAYLERSRGHSGVEILPTRGSREALERALRRGDVVGLIADRGVGRGGVAVRFFGAPARLPAGPGILEAEWGIPACAAAAIRSGWDGYRLIVLELERPLGGSPHERARQFLASVATAYQRLIAEAPEQWWSIFQPLWDDLPVGPGAPGPPGSERRGRSAA
ncbi:MAG: lysophospholipid acyltransferase family protein [Candidatus Limnocylindrales bacterium]